MFAAPAAAQPTTVTVKYSARMILAGSNPMATQDLLTQFGLQVVSGPNGPEIPFSGTFSFPHPQANQIVGTGAQRFNGRYTLSDFRINGVQLRKDSRTSMTIQLLLFPASGTTQYQDSYIVSVSNALLPAGTSRSVRLRLEVSVPSGTFGSSALPPDVNFFPLGLNYRGIPDFLYAIQTPSQYATMGGDTVWTAADVLRYCSPPVCTVAWYLRRCVHMPTTMHIPAALLKSVDRRGESSRYQQESPHRSCPRTGRQ
jgi:hypothetical protein